MPEPSPAHAWLDDFFTSYFAHRPVNATFIGVHELDDRLPDASENGVGDACADMEALLSRAGALHPETPEAVEGIDHRLGCGFLRIQLWEYGSEHFHRGNPSWYTGEAVFGAMSLFLSDYAPLRERVDAAVARLEAVPRLLAQGRAVVRDAPTAWTRRAMAECSGALAFLGEGIDLLGSADAARAPRLRMAADRAAAAFDDFAVWLERDLLACPREDVACGEEAFSLYLREGHFLDTPADEIARRARAELAEAEGRLADGARAFGASTAEEALAALEALHPSPERYYERYRETWDEMRALAEERALVTWSEVPVRFVPRPNWARKAAPDLYFLFYRAPAAYAAPPVHEHLVTPIDVSMPTARQAELLRANNDSVIKLNHVVHHAGLGHHVQNGHASRAPSRIGRVAAVDCASRIAMFCGGTMAEGWACYATDLMDEVGGLTPLESYAELRSRTRMCARAVVDVELHRGSMTLDEAAAFYRNRAGMNPRAAFAEAVKNSMFPGAALIYLEGADRIRALREEARRREGDAFDLRRFHDRLLCLGSVPVALAGQALEVAREGTT